MNSLLDHLHAAEVPVGWTTLFVGWLGPDQFPRQVTVKDIADYAVSLLLKGERLPQEDTVAQLAGAREAETVGVALRQLADCRRATVEYETRKWRVALLSQLLQNLSLDPIDGLIALSEFWGYCGYPLNMPHTVQARDDPRSPADYYTADNLAMAIRTHREWVKCELHQLSL
jgi:hypothetical protein